MKTSRTLLILAAIFLSFTWAQAQSKWSLRQNGVGPRPYTAINMKDSLHGIALGEHSAQNAITINGGEYWARRRSPWPRLEGSTMRSCFVKPGLGYFSYPNHTNLYRVSNGGLSIDSLPLSITSLWDIWFADSLSGYCIGKIWDDVQLYKTTTGGQSWNLVQTMGGFLYIDPSIEGRNMNDLWISGGKNVIRSVNGGLAWDSVAGPFRKHKIDGVDWTDANTCRIFSDSGRYYQSADGGNNWILHNIKSYQAQYDKVMQMEFADANLGFAVYYYGDFYKTTDGGQTWIWMNPLLKSVFTEGVGPFQVFSPTQIWITSATGAIAKSSNGGITWKRQTKGTNQSLLCGVIQSSNRAWAVGGNKILKTVDKGKTWAEIQLDTSSQYTKIIFPRPDVGYLIGGNTLYRTINGGASWKRIGPNVPGDVYYHDIQFVNPDSGFTSTTSGFFVTKNKGETWEQRTVWPNPAEKIHFYFADFNHGFVLTSEFENPKTYRTKDNGITWAQDTLTWQGGIVSGMHFTDSLTGVIYYTWLQWGGTLGFFRTTDGGSTWNVAGNPQPNALRGVYYGGGTTYYVNTYPNLFRKSIDGGFTWTEGDTVDIPFFTNWMSSFKGKLCLVVGSGGGIYTSNEWTGTEDYVATGKVVKKINNDCIQDANEPPVPNRFLIAEPGPYFSSTEVDGKYRMSIDTGNYIIREIRSTPTQVQLSSQYCPPGNAGVPITVNGLLDTMRNYNFIDEIRSCPVLVVKQTQMRLRPCVSNNLVITITNEGNIASDTEQVHVSFPHHLLFNTASIAFTFNTLDSTYRFKVPALQPNQSFSFTVTNTLECLPALLTGKFFCIKAVIPHTPSCLLESFGWDGANLEVASKCVGNQTRFTIHNKGVAMAGVSQYQILIDSVIVYQSSFQLAASSQMTVTLPPNAPAGYVRLVVQQTPNHPLATFAAADANCTLGFSTNGMFPPSDQSPLVDESCMMALNSYDPNDKQVYPRGVGLMGNIDPQTELTYTIRFQNTGTDTAYNVVVTDILDGDFDLASLQILQASHPYRFFLAGKVNPVLNFAFDNIYLPDSGANQLESNGFVSFSVKPKAGLAIGTRLENTADIFFDFNDPIHTNFTVNTLWSPTFDPSVLDTVFTSAGKQLNLLSFVVYPNPTKGAFEIQAEQLGTLQVFGLYGQLISSTPIVPGKNQVNLSHLSKGIYLLKLQTGQGTCSQKLVLE